MASTFTPNIGLEIPARGDDVGVWDTPWNNNTTVLDAVNGGIAFIGLNNSNVVLSAAQFRSKTIVFNSTLTGNVSITFPTSFIKSYEIQNVCTGSSAFTVTLGTSASALVIGCPPGDTVDVTNNAGVMQYRNLGHVGEYLDVCGTSVPIWISACTVPPYLNCDGTSFSSATYPILTLYMGGTTLPDSRGRCRFNNNSGTGRITSGISGVNGNVNYSAGGNQLLHAHNHTITDPTHTHGHNAQIDNGPFQVNASAQVNIPSAAIGTLNANGTGISINNFGAGGSQNMPPAYVGGLTLIRAG